MKTMRPWLANLILLAVTGVWGATFSLTKTALDFIPVMPFLAVRFLLAAVLLLCFTRLRGRFRDMYSKHTLLLGIVLGVLLFVGYVLQTLGLQTVDPGSAGFLTGLAVVIVPILAIPMLHHTPPVRTWFGACLAVAGLALLCGVQLMHLSAGDLDVLVCALFYALQILLIDKYGRSANSLALATVEIATVAVLSTAALPLNTNGFHFVLMFHPSVIWAILICAIPATAVAYFAQNVFQRYTTSAEAAVIFSMEPVFAAIIAACMGMEHMSRIQIVGGLLIVFSMLVADPGTGFGWRRKRVVVKS